MSLIPLRDGVLFRPEQEPKIRNGIIIPDTATKDRLARGIVVDVGPGKYTYRGAFIPSTMKPGMRFLYREHRRSEPITISDEVHHAISEMDVFGLVTDSPSPKEDRSRMDFLELMIRGKEGAWRELFGDRPVTSVREALDVAMAEEES